MRLKLYSKAANRHTAISQPECKRPVVFTLTHNLGAIPFDEFTLAAAL